MEVTFWTDANMGRFWEFVKMLLQTIQPGIMLMFSAVCVGILIGIVVKSFVKSSDDDDDDIEFRSY